MEGQRVAISAIATWASDYRLFWSKLRGHVTRRMPAIIPCIQQLIALLRFRMAVNTIQLVHSAGAGAGRWRWTRTCTTGKRGWGGGRGGVVASRRYKEEHGIACGPGDFPIRTHLNQNRQVPSSPSRVRARYATRSQNTPSLFHLSLINAQFAAIHHEATHWSRVFSPIAHPCRFTSTPMTCACYVLILLDAFTPNMQFCILGPSPRPGLQRLSSLSTIAAGTRSQFGQYIDMNL